MKAKIELLEDHLRRGLLEEAKEVKSSSTSAWGSSGPDQHKPHWPTETFGAAHGQALPQRGPNKLDFRE